MDKVDDHRQSGAGRRVVVGVHPPDRLRLPHSHADTVHHAGRAQRPYDRPPASHDPAVPLSQLQATTTAEGQQHPKSSPSRIIA